jgi:hypothetical protein
MSTGRSVEKDDACLGGALSAPFHDGLVGKAFPTISAGARP